MQLKKSDKLETTGQRIKYLRKKLFKLSKSKFAKKIDCSKKEVSNLENNNFSEKNINDISEEFKVNKEWLLSGQGKIFFELAPEDNIKKTINEMTNPQNSKDLILQSLQMLLPNDSISSFIISVILALFFAYFMKINNDTISLFIEINSFFFNLFLALLGVIITFLSITIAFLNGKFIDIAAKTQLIESSWLTKIIKYFTNILFLYFSVLCMLLISNLLYVTFVDDNTLIGIFNNYSFIITIFLFIYLYICIRAFLELKSIIFNIVFIIKTYIYIQLGTFK